MKKSLFLLIFTIEVVSFTISYAGDVVMQSQWKDRFINVDGSPRDWGEPPMAYFKQANMSLGVMNDSNYLYLLLNFIDQPSTKFMQRNVAIWLDKTGKNKKNFGVRYHGHARFTQENITSDSIENIMPAPDEFHNRMSVICKKDTMVLKTTGDKLGYEVVTSYEPGFYCHEVRIPIGQIDSVPYIFDAPSGKTFSIGFELGMNSDEMRNMRPKGGERPPMSGGMHRGSETDNNNIPGTQPSRFNEMQTPQKQEAWLKVKLALGKQSEIESAKEKSK
jgi:hypothetical protein